MIKKLRNKFIALTMLAVLVVMLAMMGTINYINYRNVLNRCDRVLTLLVENQGAFPATISVRPIGGGLFVRDEVTDETPRETRYFTVTVLASGTVSSINTDQITRIDPEAAVDYTNTAIKKLRKSGNMPVFIGDYRATSISTDQGTMYIFVDCYHNLENFRAFRTSSILVSILAFAGIFLLVVYFSGQIIKPVAESYEKQKRFITDAGHEIKTPLTIINADISVLEMESGEENEWLDDIKTQTKRLTRLTNDLVYLTRMEETQKNTMTMSDFDLSAVTGEIAKSFDARAVIEETPYEYQIADNLRLHGDESSIQKLVSILLDNAFKYSNGRMPIQLKVERRGRNIAIEVFNTTDQINAADLPYLFDRFYRADASRNSETGGHGIGLSIAQAITQAHGGKISAESADSKSIRITALLPA